MFRIKPEETKKRIELKLDLADLEEIIRESICIDAGDRTIELSKEHTLTIDPDDIADCLHLYIEWEDTV